MERPNGHFIHCFQEFRHDTASRTAEYHIQGIGAGPSCTNTVPGRLRSARYHFQPSATPAEGFFLVIYKAL